MCGIFGVAGVDRPIGHLDIEATRAMGASLIHRGPDGEGLWHDSRVVLGHRRLAIVDLTDRAAQPMTSASGRFVLSFNGEIYNFQELAQLFGDNAPTSDTEVLLRCIEAWGLEHTLCQLDGMFAIALWDREHQHLTLARDPFGEKPLFYCTDQGALYFASEVRAFEQIPSLKLEIDQRSIDQFLRFGYIDGTSTIYTAIARLKPGSFIRFRVDSAEIEHGTFWSAPEYSPSGSKHFDDEHLQFLLRRSVARRLTSDRPLGAFLSGGIDSSLTCVLAAEITSAPLRTFTVGWENREFDESEAASEFASAIGSQHERISLPKQAVLESFSALGATLDEPFADSSLLATHLVSTYARQHVVVALTGDGGDEMFGGYNRHAALTRYSRYRPYLPAPVRKAMAGGLKLSAPSVGFIARRLPINRRPRLIEGKIHKLAGTVASSSLTEAYQQLLTMNPSAGTEQSLRTSAVAGLNSRDPDHVFWALRVADIEGYLTSDILTKVDRASMAVSLETRTPFLSCDIAEFALSYGWEHMSGPNGGKEPLRRLLRSLVPQLGFDSPKMGFGVAVGDLLRGELREPLMDAISDHRRRGLPSSTWDWNQMAADLFAGDDQNTERLWGLMILEIWYQHRVDGRSAERV